MQFAPPVNFATGVPRVFDEIGLALVFFCSLAQRVLKPCEKSAGVNA